MEQTPIPGLVVVHLDVHGDARGWFKENWQRATMVAAGLPDFTPVQHNVSFNTDRGVARGFHAEPWDKYVAVVTGRVFAAWVDMREGESFGRTFSVEMDASVAVFVPRGVANSYQTLVDATSYSYLVTEHWRPGAAYPGVALGDPALAVEWPIPLAECELSAKDRAYGPLTPEMAVARQRPLVIGDGQLGRAWAAAFEGARLVSRDELDLTDAEAVAAWDWSRHDLVLNAAAFTAVDAAETPAGRRSAWEVNAVAPARLAALAREHGFTVVHASSDYVFDGVDAPADGWGEECRLAPLSAYGASKAAGDLAVAAAPHHYVVRTAWLVGEGDNFVATMLRLADEGVCPQVVDDQVGRLSFADEVARATRHLVESGAAWGTYHVGNSGTPRSWYEVACRVFELAGRDAADVTAVSSSQWAGRTNGPVAARPATGTLDLARLRATGFSPADADEALAAYVAAHR